MQAIEFRQQTNILAKDQKEYNNLPIYLGVAPNFEMISCHKLDYSEIETMNKTGIIWHRQLTFGQKFQPISMEVESPFEDQAISSKEFLSISEVASLYGKIVSCEWLAWYEDNFEPKQMKVDASFLLQMEKGSIKNVKK